MSDNKTAILGTVAIYGNCWLLFSMKISWQLLQQGFIDGCYGLIAQTFTSELN